MGEQQDLETFTGDLCSYLDSTQDLLGENIRQQKEILEAYQDMRDFVKEIRGLLKNESKAPIQRIRQNLRDVWAMALHISERVEQRAKEENWERLLSRKLARTGKSDV